MKNSRPRRGGRAGLIPAASTKGGFKLYEDYETRVTKALALIAKYGDVDSRHQKQWVLDQVVQILTGPWYLEWVDQLESSFDTPEDAPFRWEEGEKPEE